VTSVEEGIDDLYKGSLADFIAARTALARTLKGAAARRVKAQQKPSVGAWAVNQVYWHARPVWDRVAKSGERLRAGQIAALKGRRADLRGAADAHQTAIAAGVTHALRFAAAHSLQPGSDELTRTFEALSLARQWPEPPGRLTRPLKPAGFEALAGVVVKPRVTAVAAPAPPRTSPVGPARNRDQRDDREQVQQARRQREQAAAERRKQEALRKAQAAVARAEAAETRARQIWERTRQDLERARASLGKVDP
jgi:hypothetical protein